MGRRGDEETIRAQQGGKVHAQKAKDAEKNQREREQNSPIPENMQFSGHALVYEQPLEENIR